MSSRTDITLGFLGCGNLGFAILKSLVDGIAGKASTSSDDASTASLPDKLIACVRSGPSKQKLAEALSEHQDIVRVLKGQNVEGVKASDMIILACKPHMVKGVMEEQGLLEALRGKLLISVVAGWKTEQLDELVNAGQTSDNKCRVVRVMPNVGAMISESMTAIEITEPALPESLQQVIDAIFKQVGQIVHLPPTLIDAATALCGSTPAFFAIFCESLIDGAVAMGVPRESAKLITYQVLKGTAGLLQNGDHPATLKEKVTSPGGCTIGGVMVLEEAGVRGSISKALREATSIAALLGSGKQNVNGTRF